MANINSQMKIQGLEQTLKTLKKLEPDYVKEMNRQIRKQAAPTVKSIKDYLKFIDSDLTPFNNTGESRITKGVLIKSRGADTRWDRQLILRGIRFKLGGPKRKARMGNATYSMFSIVQNNPAGAIYDNAGSRNLGKPGNKFNENLQQEDKPHTAGERKGRTGPSRYMWPGGEAHLPELEIAIHGIVQDVILRVNRETNARK
jgi:hypothetical protein